MIPVKNYIFRATGKRYSVYLCLPPQSTFNMNHRVSGLTANLWMLKVGLK